MGWVAQRMGGGTWRPISHGCVALGPQGTPRVVASPPAARSLASRAAIGGGVFAPSSRRAKMPGNPGTLGSGTLAYTPAIVLQVRRTGVRVWAGWNFFACAGAVRKAGSGAGGSLVPVVPTWQACFGACLSGAAFLVLCWGSRCSLYAWTYKRATEDARALVLSRIWSS